MFRALGTIATAAALLALGGSAHATIADWRVNEILPAWGGDPAIRYVELFVPFGTAGNCLFPTTRIEVFDGKGMLLGTATPFATTVCYPEGTFFLLASSAAATQFGVTADAALPALVPAFAGQVCFASSQTRYDCARWGPVTDPVGYLRSLDDAGSAGSIPDGQALARIGDTGSIAADFVVESPTPGRANDGTVYTGPDAAPPPDAPLARVDAGVPDARTFARPDAAPVVRPDALLDPRFLSADPGGGAACNCQLRDGGRAPSPVTVLALLGLAAWRRRARPRGGGRGSGRAACRSPR